MQIIMAVSNDKGHLLEWKSSLSAHYDVLPVKSVRAALRLLKDILPDMLLIDFNMSEMNGVELMEKVHQNQEWSNIPAILSSDEPNPEMEKLCFQSGAVEYVRYPIDKEILLLRVRHSMEVQHTRQRLEVEVLKKSLEIERKNAEMERQKTLVEFAKHDGLTGVLTRYDATKQINAYLSKKKTGAFLILDMDNFKAVNDTYGHLEGDRLLVQFAKTLEREAGKNAIVARLGGDEFIAFLPQKDMKKEIRAVAASIVKRVERDIVSPGRLIRVTVSMGIAVAPVDGTNFEELYSKADKALYYVKREGKNDYHFFSENGNGSIKKKVTYSSLSDIKRNMGEKIVVNGSYMVDYNSFEKIYRFIERNVKRDHRQVQCVLFTITNKEDLIESSEDMRVSLEELGDVVVKSLRKGDVSTYYSATQLLVLLLDTDEENATMVVERIMSQYHAENKTDDLVIDYEIQTVTGEVSEITEVV